MSTKYIETLPVRSATETSQAADARVEDTGVYDVGMMMAPRSRLSISGGDCGLLMTMTSIPPMTDWKIQNHIASIITDLIQLHPLPMRLPFPNDSQVEWRTIEQRN